MLRVFVRGFTLKTGSVSYLPSSVSSWGFCLTLDKNHIWNSVWCWGVGFLLFQHNGSSLLIPQEEPPDIKWKVSVSYTGHTAVRLGVSHILNRNSHSVSVIGFSLCCSCSFFLLPSPSYSCASIAHPTPGQRENKNSMCTVCVCGVCVLIHTCCKKSPGLRNSTSVGFLQGEETRAFSFFVFVLNRLFPNWLEKYC